MRRAEARCVAAEVKESLQNHLIIRLAKDMVKQILALAMHYNALHCGQMGERIIHHIKGILLRNLMRDKKFFPLAGLSLSKIYS